MVGAGKGHVIQGQIPANHVSNKRIDDTPPQMENLNPIKL